MEIKDILEYYKAPDVALSDIIVQDITQTRLLALLISNGVKTTGDLRKMTDDDLMGLTLFGKVKLGKLENLLADWYEADFPVTVHVKVSNPETVLESLESRVFGTYKNLEIGAMRGSYKTYEEIGEQLGQSRQSVQFAENLMQKRFDKWYEAERISERIGNYDDFLLYCEKNFPEDQRMAKAAVKNMVLLAKKRERKNKAASK